MIYKCVFRFVTTLSNYSTAKTARILNGSYRNYKLPSKKKSRKSRIAVIFHFDLNCTNYYIIFPFRPSLNLHLLSNGIK